MSLLRRLIPDAWCAAGAAPRLAGRLWLLLGLLLSFIVLNALVGFASLYFVRQANEDLSQLEALGVSLAQFDVAQLRLQRSGDRVDALQAAQKLGQLRLEAAALPANLGLDVKEEGETALALLAHQFEAYLLYQEQAAALDHSMHKQLDALLESLDAQDAGDAHTAVAVARSRLNQAVLRVANLHQEFMLQPQTADSTRMRALMADARGAAQQLRALVPQVEGQIAAYNMGRQMLLLESVSARQILYAQRKLAQAAALQRQYAHLAAQISARLEQRRQSISRQMGRVVSGSLLLSAGIFGLAFLFGRRLLRSITQPLTRLLEATEAFAHGRFVSLGELSGLAEVDELARSFQGMQRRVLAQIEQIRQSGNALRERTVQLEQAHRATAALNLSLEVKVALRTAELDKAYACLAEEHQKLGQMYQQLEHTQSQLLHSEKMASVGQLAAGVAHEINNPVSFIRSNMNMLGEYVADLLRLVDAAPDTAALRAVALEVNLDFLRRDASALLAETREGVERVCEIVAGLREYSHAGEPDWQQSDLLVGLESTIRMVWHELKLKIELRRALQPLPPVRCIPAQINQVFMNLLMNASQAIPGHGTIILRSGHEGDFVWVEIEDDGVGMDEAVQRRMCEPFFTTKPVGKGTGLGMSISYEVIRRHGGQLTVRSAPGEGACLRVTLPVAGPEGAGLTPPAPAPERVALSA